MADYMSQAWMDECRQMINSDESVQKATRGTFTLTFQHYVTGVPSELGGKDIPFYSVFDHGQAVEVAIGVIDSPDVTLTADYRAWKKIHTGNTGMVASTLLRRLKVKVKLSRAAVLGWRYRKMFKMTDAIATIPTDFCA
jgi:putative sterol carrier protein